MEKRIGVIGHVDHGKTILLAAELALNKQKADLITIQESIEEDRSIKITNAPEFKNIEPFEIKDGKQLRRERRAKERKSKK